VIELRLVARHSRQLTCVYSPCRSTFLCFCTQPHPMCAPLSRSIVITLYGGTTPFAIDAKAQDETAIIYPSITQKVGTPRQWVLAITSRSVTGVAYVNLKATDALGVSTSTVAFIKTRGMYVLCLSLSLLTHFTNSFNPLKRSSSFINL
jgi:hypothetical protein